MEVIVCFAEFVGLRHAHAPTGANVKNFSLSADGVLFVLLEKGKRPTFSLSERKRLIYIHEKSVRRKFFSVQSIPWIV